MRIICFTDSLVSGGAQRQLVNIAMLLKERGHDVYFVVYRDMPFFENFLKSKDIYIHIVKNNNYIDRIFKIYRLFLHISPDIIISFLETPNFISCFSSIGKHHWKLITNELSAKTSSFKGIRSYIFKWFERYSDAIVCNSYNSKKMWENYYPQYNNKLHTIYNPIIVPDIQSGKIQDHPKTKMVVPASYQYLKNPINVIKAISKLNTKEKEAFELHWYGRIEPSHGEVQAYNKSVKLIKDCNLSNTVFLHEETRDIYRIISESDVVGLFSTVEGLPNAICEGMMLGKPVIMSQVSDYNLFITKDNGIQCNPNSVESITEALRFFLSLKQEIRTKMGNASKELAKQLFDKDKIMNEWESLFLKLLREE